jgi:glycosyltransferase involved in cell wall biosynthesis
VARPAVVMLSGIRWDFLWQRHQILATHFARAGYATVFVETTGLSNPRPGLSTLKKAVRRLRRSRYPGEVRTEENLTVYSPLVAPPTASLFRRLNRRVFVPRVARELVRIAGPEPLVVAYPPTRTTLDLASALKPRRLLYDLSDDYEGFPGVPPDIARIERELISRADAVSCTSTPLLEKVKPLRPDAFLCGPGVDFGLFEPLRESRPRREPRTVCYFGHVSEERTDFGALRAMAAAGFEVRIVGGLGRLDRRFLRTSGVDYRGEAPHAELPAALAGADALVLPYRRSRLTESISPAKTYECLATGLPVVATPLPALAELGDHIYLADGAEGFVEALRALPGTEDEARRRARISIARSNSWEARFREIEERLCGGG